MIVNQIQRMAAPEKRYGATETADGTIKYYTVLYGVSISDWVQNVYRTQSIEYGWIYYPLAEGSFEFDNLVHSITALLSRTRFDSFDSLTFDQTRDMLADLVHQGWVKNYIYWRDNEPWVSNRLYRAPHNSLGDARRNKCALTSYSELNADEKDKDIVVVNAILKLLGIS